MATTLRKYKFLTFLFRIRDWMWTKLGLFDLKRSIKRKRYFKRVAKEDETRRKIISEKIMQLPSEILKPIEGVNLIVSMTSYGKRLENTCPYALYSILQQALLPNRIVLNIDKNKWNNNNLPTLIKKLQQVGVEINFIEDIGPHSKLIPTLLKYKNDIIITTDDDVWYDSTMIEELMTAYQKSDKETIFCREGTIYLNCDGELVTYNQQQDIRTNPKSEYVIPMGFAGVLYPPNVFPNEVFNIEKIKQLCPKADDVWFGAIEIYGGVKARYLENNSWPGNSDIDRNEEYNANVSGALHFTNNSQGLNDVQWQNLVEYYKLAEIVKNRLQSEHSYNA